MTFGRFLIEDYLMASSLVLLLVTTIAGQVSVQYIFQMVAVSNGEIMPPADFLDDTSTGLRSFASLMILNYVGIWLIKLNFLFFFRRLGNHVDKYRYLWWFVLMFNLAAGVTCIGLIDFKCVLPPAEEIFATCNGIYAITASYTAAKATASLDAVGYALSEYSTFTTFE